MNKMQQWRSRCRIAINRLGSEYLKQNPVGCDRELIDYIVSNCPFANDFRLPAHVWSSELSHYLKYKTLGNPIPLKNPRHRRKKPRIPEGQLSLF